MASPSVSIDTYVTDIEEDVLGSGSRPVSGENQVPNSSTGGEPIVGSDTGVQGWTVIVLLVKGSWVLGECSAREGCCP